MPALSFAVAVSLWCHPERDRFVVDEARLLRPGCRLGRAALSFAVVTCGSSRDESLLLAFLLPQKVLRLEGMSPLSPNDLGLVLIPACCDWKRVISALAFPGAAFFAGCAKGALAL